MEDQIGVTWDFTDEKVDRQTILNVGSELGVQFPEDYIECVMENSGGIPTPECIMVKGYGVAVFDVLLGFVEDSELHIWAMYNNIKDRLVDGIYPFAIDAFGNFFCFDTRDETEGKPTVVFWNHEVAAEYPEKAILPLCNTFTELLTMLYDE